MKTAIKFFQTLVIALAISFTLLSVPGMASPAAADDCQPLPEGRRTYGIVSRVNVADFKKSKAFYGKTLGATCIQDFDGPDWTEFYVFDRPDARASIGLSNRFGDSDLAPSSKKPKNLILRS